MKKTTSKSLYLFLCSIMGMVLFAMLHRAVFVLYDLLLLVDYDTYSFGMPAHAITTMDFFTMIVMIFLGGWYGIMLGLEWYAMVYGPNAERPAGIFHAFKPHHWRKTVPAGTKPRHLFARRATHIETAPAPEATSTVVKVPVSSHEWNFDDLLAAKPAPKKRAVRKSAAKTLATKTKTVRKTTKRVKAVVASAE